MSQDDLSKEPCKTKMCQTNRVPPAGQQSPILSPTVPEALLPVKKLGHSNHRRPGDVKPEQTAVTISSQQQNQCKAPAHTCRQGNPQKLQRLDCVAPQHLAGKLLPRSQGMILSAMAPHWHAWRILFAGACLLCRLCCKLRCGFTPRPGHREGNHL